MDLSPPDDLQDLVAREIVVRGPMGFGRFMELALYHPTLGFYATRGAGRRGDFITSVEVGPLFGAVVVRALDGWWEDLGRPSDFTFIEAGAGTGTLARSVLRCDLACIDALNYVAVETSNEQRAKHPSGIASASTIPETGGPTIIFANELLDNLPFDIFEWVPSLGWSEIRVATTGSGFCEMAVDTDFSLQLAGVTDRTLRVPRQARAQEWLSKAFGAIERGRVVVIDYAVPTYPVDAHRAWLRTYRDHRRTTSPLVAPGTVDITVDVDISQLAEISAPSTVRSQAAWLESFGIEALVAEGNRAWAANAAIGDLRSLEARSRAGEAAALLDPSGLGGFSVIEWVLDR